MIGRIFLGKPWHWLLLLIPGGLLWFFGSKRLHVIEFNLFIIAMLAGATVIILLLAWFHREGDQVTRDALVARAFDPKDTARIADD